MTCKCTRCGRPVVGPTKVEAVGGFVGKIQFRDHKIANPWLNEPSIGIMDHERQFWEVLAQDIRWREMMREQRAGFARSSWV